MPVPDVEVQTLRGTESVSMNFMLHQLLKFFYNKKGDTGLGQLEGFPGFIFSV